MYKDIVIPIDVSDEESWKAALPAALEFVRTQGSKLHFVTVVPEFGMSMVSQYFADDAEERMLKDAQTALHAFVDKHVPNDLDVQCIVAQGTVYRRIIQTAKQIKADLIVIAAHRPELKDYLLGPNAAKVVRHSDISVLVVR